MRLEAKVDLFAQFTLFSLYKINTVADMINMISYKIKSFFQKNNGFLIVSDLPSLFNYTAWYRIKFVDDDLLNLSILADGAATGDNNDTF